MSRLDSSLSSTAPNARTDGKARFSPTVWDRSPAFSRVSLSFSPPCGMPAAPPETLPISGRAVPVKRPWKRPSKKRKPCSPPAPAARTPPVATASVSATENVGPVLKKQASRPHSSKTWPMAVSARPRRMLAPIAEPQAMVAAFAPNAVSTWQVPTKAARDAVPWHRARPAFAQTAGTGIERQRPVIASPYTHLKSSHVRSCPHSHCPGSIRSPKPSLG